MREDWPPRLWEQSAYGRELPVSGQRQSTRCGCGVKGVSRTPPSHWRVTIPIPYPLCRRHRPHETVSELMPRNVPRGLPRLIPFCGTGIPDSILTMLLFAICGCVCGSIQPEIAFLHSGIGDFFFSALRRVRSFLSISFLTSPKMNNPHKIRLSVFLFIFKREIYIYCIFFLKRPPIYARAREEINQLARCGVFHGFTFFGR